MSRSSFAMWLLDGSIALLTLLALNGRLIYRRRWRRAWDDTIKTAGFPNQEEVSIELGRITRQIGYIIDRPDSEGRAEMFEATLWMILKITESLLKDQRDVHAVFLRSVGDPPNRQLTPVLSIGQHEWPPEKFEEGTSSGDEMFNAMKRNEHIRSDTGPTAVPVVAGRIPYGMLLVNCHPTYDVDVPVIRVLAGYIAVLLATQR